MPPCTLQGMARASRQDNRPWIIAWVSKRGRCTSLISRRPSIARLHVVEPCPCSTATARAGPARTTVPPVSVTRRIAFSALAVSRSFAHSRLFLPRKRGGDSVHIPRCSRSSPKPRVESLEKQMGTRRRFTAAYSASMRKSNNTMTFIRSCFLARSRSPSFSRALSRGLAEG